MVKEKKGFQLGNITDIRVVSERSGKYTVYVEFLDHTGAKRKKSYKCHDKGHAEYICERLNRSN